MGGDLDDGGNSRSPAAWIDGAPASIEAAAEAAARMLKASRQPLFAGLGVDIDGARAAVALAERVGGVVEHTHSAALLSDLDCQRETGVMITTASEARVRADLVLLVGDGLEESWPALGERLLRPPPTPPGGETVRKILWLAPRADVRLQGYDGEIDVIGANHDATLMVQLAALRACGKSRRVDDAGLAELERFATALKSARFGVAVWSAARLSPLELEMVNGLARDLNDATRFSTLPLSPPDNGAGVLAVCGWMTGFPMRTGFGALGPLHDPWRFDAERLISAGETDCVVWISAFGAPPPAATDRSISVALCDRATPLAATPKVRIEVGRPGVDHDAVLHNAETGTLVAAPAVKPAAGAPSVAAALALIAARLDDGSAWVC